MCASISTSEPNFGWGSSLIIQGGHKNLNTKYNSESTSHVTHRLLITWSQCTWVVNLTPITWKEVTTGDSLLWTENHVCQHQWSGEKSVVVTTLGWEFILYSLALNTVLPSRPISLATVWVLYSTLTKSGTHHRNSWFCASLEGVSQWTWAFSAKMRVVSMRNLK